MHRPNAPAASWRQGLAVSCGGYIIRRFDDITSQKTTPSNADAPDL